MLAPGQRRRAVAGRPDRRFGNGRHRLPVRDEGRDARALAPGRRRGRSSGRTAGGAAGAARGTTRRLARGRGSPGRASTTSAVRPSIAGRLSLSSPAETAEDPEPHPRSPAPRQARAPSREGCRSSCPRLERSRGRTRGARCRASGRPSDPRLRRLARPRRRTGGRTRAPHVSCRSATARAGPVTRPASLGRQGPGNRQTAGTLPPNRLRSRRSDEQLQVPVFRLPVCPLGPVELDEPTLEIG